MVCTSFWLVLQVNQKDNHDVFWLTSLNLHKLLVPFLPQPWHLREGTWNPLGGKFLSVAKWKRGLWLVTRRATHPEPQRSLTQGEPILGCGRGGGWPGPGVLQRVAGGKESARLCGGLEVVGMDLLSTRGSSPDPNPPIRSTNYIRVT